MEEAALLKAELRDKTTLYEKLEKELAAETQQVVLLREKDSILENDEQHIYEELPASLSRNGDDKGSIRMSFLQAMENLDISKEADCSKPYVANLEASSQLEESSSCESGVGVVIDATPLPVCKRTRQGKLREHKDENKDLQDFTPRTQKRFRGLAKSAKQQPQNTAASSTTTRRPWGKDQISGPLSFTESPMAITTKGKIRLASRLKVAEFN